MVFADLHPLEAHAGESIFQIASKQIKVLIVNQHANT
jgi:hypothetical protein